MRRLAPGKAQTMIVIDLQHRCGRQKHREWGITTTHRCDACLARAIAEQPDNGWTDRLLSLIIRHLREKGTFPQLGERIEPPLFEDVRRIYQIRAAISMPRHQIGIAPS